MKLEAASPLSAREKEVLQLVAEGLSNKEIALRLKLSSSTVKRHVEHILRKLHAKNRVEAAVYAAKQLNRLPVNQAKTKS